MNKHGMQNIKYFFMIVLFALFISWAIKQIAKDDSDYEVITPKEGVECVVVSRMFNTSVDCWKVNNE